MNPTHAPRAHRPRAARAASGWMPALLLATLAGCATTGSGGGGLVPVRADRPARTAAAPDTSRPPLSPAAIDPANAGADDVPVPSPTPVPAPGEVVGSTASGGQIMRRVPAAVDSGPSDEARQVLGTIPEPIPAGSRVPAPSRVEQLYPPRDATPGAFPADTLTPGAVDDSLAAPGAIPTPEPTLPLGQRRPSPIPTIPDSVLRAMADSAGRRPAGAAPAGGVPAAAAPAPAPAVPDSCWRVQVAAPEEAERAEQLRAAAASLLLVPMVVERDQGLHKVRTRDCLSAAGAKNLRDRAETSGFTGAFRFLRKP